MTLNRNTTQKPLTAKTSVETGTKRTNQFNKTENTEKNQNRKAWKWRWRSRKADEKCTCTQK